MHGENNACGLQERRQSRWQSCVFLRCLFLGLAAGVLVMTGEAKVCHVFRRRFPIGIRLWYLRLVFFVSTPTPPLATGIRRDQRRRSSDFDVRVHRCCLTLLVSSEHGHGRAVALIGSFFV